MPEMCIIESDNCNAQYKSAQHFEAIQCLSTTFKIPVVRIFSIAGHGKGEVDHAEGLAKCAIRQYFGSGGKMADAADCVEFLQQKYFGKTRPSFVVEEITKKELENARAEARLKKYPTIDGSDRFQVMVFT